MANTHTTLASLFADIADAIREKSGSSATIVADDFPAAIRALNVSSGETGGDNPGGEASTITFTCMGEDYTCASGMTWEQYVASSSNTRFDIVGDYVTHDTIYLVYEDYEYVRPTDTIIDGETYQWEG